MNKNYQKIISILGKNRVRVDEPMAKHTTFKIGGPADLFYEARTEEELVRVVRAVREMGVSYFILGNGSNLLVGDRGIRGMVIKIQNAKVKKQNDNSKFKILADAGALLAEVVNFATKNSLGGLEFLTGIPGSVGGAVRGNAGAWQKTISGQVTKVKILSPDGKIKFLNQKDCQFSYRQSRFKKTEELILEIELEVEKKDKGEIEKLIEEYTYKRSHQPKEASAGSIFINPKPYVAGEMIDRCGLKGKKIGRAQISPKHANFIVNLGGAKATDVVALINLAREKVKEKFGIELKEEIVRVGEF